MSQDFIVKEIKPSTGDNKPTIVITEDGSRLSGFQDGLKSLTPGTKFKAETKIEKGYINISKYEVIGDIKPLSNGYDGDSLEKRASIETQNAITNIMKAYVAMWNGPSANQPSIRLADLWERALDWCDSKIPLSRQKVDITAFGDKERKQYDTGSGKEEVILGPPFENAGDFWTKASKKFGKPQSDLVAALEIRTAKDLTNFDLAWDTLCQRLPQ